jgi:hypothetical protein
MTNAERTIADDCGFQIIDRGDRILFINRRTLGPAVAAWVLGGIAFITGVNGVIFAALIFGGENPAPWYLPVYMAGASIVFVFAAQKAFSVYRRRRDAAVEEVPGNIAAHMGPAVLVDERRATLAPLADVRVKTGIDLFDSTRGLMRTLTLVWPGGSQRVYKTNGAEEIRRVAAALSARGVGE